jgi:hypothetical protein
MAVGAGQIATKHMSLMVETGRLCRRVPTLDSQVALQADVGRHGWAEVNGRRVVRHPTDLHGLSYDLQGGPQQLICVGDVVGSLAESHELDVLFGEPEQAVRHPAPADRCSSEGVAGCRHYRTHRTEFRLHGSLP